MDPVIIAAADVVVFQLIPTTTKIGAKKKIVYSTLYSCGSVNNECGVAVFIKSSIDKWIISYCC